MNSPSSPGTSRLTLVALCGPPASGKSTLARALSEALGAPVLDKDRVREALFGPRGVEYTSEQDAHCAQVLLDTASWLARRGRAPVAILDGRTFRRAVDVEQAVTAARHGGYELRFVECTADERVLRERLARDHEAGRHPAANRDVHLLDRWLSSREPLTVPRLTLDTARLSLAEQVARVREFLAAPPPDDAPDTRPRRG